LAAAILCALIVPAAYAQTKPEVITSQDQILKRFPKDASLIQHGAKVRLKSGDWLEVTDNPFGKAPPRLCWYAPSLHVIGICQSGRGATVTTLIELNSGRRVAAPGAPRLMPEPGLIAVGPDKAKGVESDSVTLVRVEKDDIIDEGGALFDQDYGPGGWVDGDCYRLTGKGGKGAAWLERTPAGWLQAPAGESKVCQGRHGH
jgi:hypothetical protein